ncbi:hypothetical protein XENOCAPTIV_022893 [Xenoophorus captivus]|uniref:Enamelin n=1 Tax=Xenoophorus captivus TaxID=1517983 RepID=A0ABV0QF17_9TELE
MKQILISMCLLVSTFAAPAPGSESSEQVAAHANEALRLMEMYRLYQQQGLGNPFLPAADPPVVASQAQLTPVPAEDVSDEETEDGNPAARVAVPGAPAAPLNSDEEEEDEEAAEVEPTVVDVAPPDPTAAPAAAVEPEVVVIPPDVAPVVDVVVAVPPVDVVPVDTASEVAVDVAGPAATDIPAVDVAATTAAAEVFGIL